MEDAVKRPYKSRVRAAAAAEKRAAIRTAAMDLFLQKGYSATTLKEVAARAGVGERTLYDGFPTKGALFEHVAAVAITGDEEPVALADRPEFQAALNQSDPHRAVALYAAYSAEVLERAAPLINVAIESAGADPVLRRFSDQGAAATRANTRAFVDSLVKHRLLEGDPEDLAMAAFALVVPLVHQQMRRDLGWSAQRYQRWLESSLARILLGR
jgi:AcrR family transcriptional regulator